MDVLMDEIPIDEGTALWNSEFGVPAEGLASGAPKTLEVPQAASNIEKRSTYSDA
jgi:hypothetical protein